MGHQLYFVVPQSLASEAHDAKAALLDCFESVDVMQMDMEPLGGWPYGPNAHFYACALFMFNQNKTLPWQLVELDCLLTRSNGYDLIAAKYASCGSPFFGHVSKTPWRETGEVLFDSQGKPTTVPNPRLGHIVPSLGGDADTMMSGCAVYPGNLFDRPNFYKAGHGLMSDFMKGQESIDMAWDMHLRHAMHKDGLAHTELIAQHWNTGNYRIEGESLVCDANETHEIFLKNPKWEIRKCGGIVHPDAVMIHGCKDDSLFKLIVSDSIPQILGRSKATVVVPVAAVSQSVASDKPSVPYTIQPVSDPRVDKMQSQLDQIMGMLAQMAPKPAEPKAAPPELDPAVAEPILQKVLAALPTVGHKQMLSAIAKAILEKKDQIKAAIASSDKFKIAGPAEWVTRIAA